jgi:hypothetical protein
MPVFDGFSMGYIIPLWTDVYVTRNEEGVYYRWGWGPANGELITHHSERQLPTFPIKQISNGYPKWTNPWSIQTPKGYSCLFVSPLNHANLIFNCLSGVVDTDQYNNMVNFPFTFNDPNFEGLIPAGTPIIQVIPFKRESWTSKVDNERHFSLQNNALIGIKHLLFDGYRSKFWVKKEFK